MSVVARLHRRPYLMSTVATALAAAALVLVAWGAGFDAVGARFATVVPGWIALVLGGEVVAYLGYTIGYRSATAVAGGPDLPLPLSARVVAVGFGPFAAGGGFTIDHRALRAVSEDRRAATVRVLGLGALEYAILAPATAAAAAALIVSGGKAPAALTVPWLVATPVGFAIALSLARPDRRSRDGSRLRDALEVALAGVWALVLMARDPRRHGGAFPGLALYWAGDIAAFFGALQLFSVHISVPAAIVAYATGYALTRRTLPLAGAGATDALLVVSLHWIGVPWAAAVAPVAAYRVVNLGASLVPALGVRPTVRRLLESDSAADVGAELRGQGARERGPAREHGLGGTGPDAEARRG